MLFRSPQLLTTVPEGMAGFLDRPYSLARNRISPPIPLQMLIFPWIEFAFGVDNAWWKQECLDEMNEVIKDISTTTPSTKASRKDGQAGTKGDKATSRTHKRKAGDSKGKQVKRGNRDDEDDAEADSAQDETYDDETESDAGYVASAYSTPTSTAQEQEADRSEDEDGTAHSDGQSPPTTFSEANKAKASFLRLLVRCRRIVLQDAAYRLHRHQPNKILDHDIFRCTMFKSFQKEIGAAVDKDAALSRKRPREKSPLTTLSQLRPNHAARARPPVQQQQEQPAAIAENPSTAGHHYQQQQQQQQQQRHQSPALGALDRFGGEEPSTQPSSTANHHHNQPLGQALESLDRFGGEEPSAQPSSTSNHHHNQPRGQVLESLDRFGGEEPSAQPSSTANHHHNQPRGQALESLDRFGGEEPSTQPASTANHHHYQPRGQAPPSSTLASLEQQMLQLQHMVQAWSQNQEAQMQQMFAQHMKIHEMQQQMITTMMTALRTQQSPQMQFQYRPAGSSTGALPPPPPPHGHQQPNGVSSHATDALGAIGNVTAVPMTAGTSSSKLHRPQQEMHQL